MYSPGPAQRTQFRGNAPPVPGLLVRILSKQTLSRPRRHMRRGFVAVGANGPQRMWPLAPTAPKGGVAGAHGHSAAVAGRPGQAGMATNGWTVGCTVPPGGSTVMP